MISQECRRELYKAKGDFEYLNYSDLIIALIDFARNEGAKREEIPEDNEDDSINMRGEGML